MVDLACMRDAMNNLGGDSNKINPLVCILKLFQLNLYKILQYNLYNLILIV